MSERGPYRLDRASRLRSSKDYRRLNRIGIRARGTGFIMLGCRDADPSRRARVGITTSRRIGNAVVRNRVKRQVREWFRTGSAATAGGCDFVVVARAGVGDWTAGRIRAELARLMELLREDLCDERA